MRQNGFSFRGMRVFIAACLMGSLFIIGCKKDDSPAQSAAMDAQATQDAAQSISEAFSQYNGGAFDQIADVMNIATVAGISGGSGRLVAGTSSPESVVKSYDTTTGWWTVTIDRSYNTSAQPYNSTYHRVYKYQFLNSLGNPQKNYIVNNNGVADTAYQINHQIVEGSGSANTPRVNHKLLSLSGAWVVTNANKATVTLNTSPSAPYNRQASDTVNTVAGAVRTLNNSLTLNLINVTGLRGSGLNWHQKTSGTITGTYHATVTFQKGETYSEKTIDRSFTITLGGAKPVLSVGGKIFQMDPLLGDLN